MYCNNCGYQLKDGDLVCAECRTRVAQDIQTERVTGARQNMKNNLKAAFTSPAQVVYAVFMSIVAVLGVVSFGNGLMDALQGKDVVVSLSAFMISAVFTVIPTVFAGIAAGAAWTMIGSKNVTGSRVRKLANYARVQKGFGLGYSIVFGIATVAAVVGLSALAWALASDPALMIDYPTLYEILREQGVANARDLVEGLKEILEFGIWNVTLIVAIIMGGILTVMIFMVTMYDRACKYYGMLAKAMDGGQCKVNAKRPCARLFAFGGMTALGALSMLGSSEFFLTGLAGLATGGYLIVMGIQFVNIHAALVRDAEVVKEENRVLEQISAHSDRQLADLIRVEREARWAQSMQAQAQQPVAPQAQAQQSQPVATPQEPDPSAAPIVSEEPVSAASAAEDAAASVTEPESVAADDTSINE